MFTLSAVIGAIWSAVKVGMAVYTVTSIATEGSRLMQILGLGKSCVSQIFTVMK